MVEHRRSRRILTLVFVAVILALSNLGTTLAADADNPLAPLDTSSPRATLSNFVGTMNNAHTHLMETVQSYLNSSRLYLSMEERAEIDRLYEKFDIARRTLNLSEMPAALPESISVYRVLQLKEVLDRLELPAFGSIPDATAMEAAQFKRWTIPDTEKVRARVNICSRRRP